ncbi:MAG TPA: hypothetical protein VGN11_03580, partial [Candidatus Baltobacteraceae bacterium]|nr:hypothetical protein [Candidatus Baltobacteraceae bacterium]
METASTTLLEATADLQQAGKPLWRAPHMSLQLGATSLWIVLRLGKSGTLALRTAYAAGGIELVAKELDARGGRVDLRSDAGRYRVSFERRKGILHATTWLTPSRPLKMLHTPRDLIVSGSGTVHTAQRGPRTGLVFATLREPRGGTFCYVQNLGALNDYSKATRTSPAGRVGGEWPELGYSPAPNPDHALAADAEVVISDVYLALDSAVPQDELETAALFLDLLAEVYVRLPRPGARYRDWPAIARRTVRDLAFSPECTYRRQGKRYLMPYVGDREKPPESMVQLTVLLPLLEYEEWSGREFVLARRLLQALPSFFDPRVGSIVRWLPGETFGETGEEGQSHANMDSWYLYHILFNISRLASLGYRDFSRLFENSLPYAIRVARRFDYRFPVFFDINTLGVVRGESKPGAGGEHDVAGLYALVMLHAYELFGKTEYLDEAIAAANSLENLGFNLGYQMNTTGFATEAMLRLYLLTGEQRYAGLVDVCLANVFENMWIWDCSYGHAVNYQTFFGLFPLRDAPYLAPYEELEALAKFHDLLKMGGHAIRPSARMLIAEYGKYALDRVWHYFPENLDSTALSNKPRNGHLDCALAVPVEDLQDGWELSGQVGQEIYGSGVALVYTTRHFKAL